MGEATTATKTIFRVMRYNLSKVQRLHKSVGKINDRPLFGKPEGYWLFTGASGKCWKSCGGKMIVELCFEPAQKRSIRNTDGKTLHQFDMYPKANLKRVIHVGARRGRH